MILILVSLTPVVHLGNSIWSNRTTPDRIELRPKVSISLKILATNVSFLPSSCLSSSTISLTTKSFNLPYIEWVSNYNWVDESHWAETWSMKGFHKQPQEGKCWRVTGQTSSGKIRAKANFCPKKGPKSSNDPFPSSIIFHFHVSCFHLGMELEDPKYHDGFNFP